MSARPAAILCIALAAAAVEGACTQDFDKFEGGGSVPDGGPRPASDAATPPKPVDAGPDAATCSGCGAARTTCNSGCEQTKNTCVDKCASPRCRRDCDEARDACVDACRSTCRSCATGCTNACD